MTLATRKRLMAFVSLVAMTSNAAVPAMAAVTGLNDNNTATPIKHVIVIVGENTSFDYLFGTYVPPTGTVSNILSKGIVNADGTPGPNVALAKQYSATVTGTYSIAPANKVAYANLPPMMTGGTSPTASDTSGSPLATVATATVLEGVSLYTSGANSYTSTYPNVSPTAAGNDVVLTTTGASGLPKKSIDTRVANAAAPANAPIPLTGAGSTLTYDSYTSNPVHRFYQMWQEMDCAAAYATAANPSGCLNDLFPWVDTSVGAGSNGNAQPANFTNMTTGNGSTSMGFYNVQTGDMPYFKQLADTYAVGDNYHQPAKGGTGLDSLYLGFAGAVYYADANGQPATPPSNQIENPNPQPGTNNYYTQDGYSGGSYSNCSDSSQPGVQQVVKYLNHLSYKPFEACLAHAYYLLNNYNPGYAKVDQTTGLGVPAPLGATQFTIPPTHQASIANVLDTAHVSWTYYGQDWNAYAKNGAYVGGSYCNICNPFLFQTSVMNNKHKVKNNLKDLTDFYADVSNGVLPAVSYIKPNGLNDGHATSSKFDIFEAFTKKIVDAVQGNATLAANTAIMITTDEGGGYWDSGFIQTVDFFGDGTRIPMIVVSPFSKGVGPVHEYGDHASFVKFVEANWKISAKISPRTRDNLPNPITSANNPYVPTNEPAIGDLMSYFKFQ